MKISIFSWQETRVVGERDTKIHMKEVGLAGSLETPQPQQG